MKTLFITLLLFPIFAICQEEHEILNTGTRPNGLSDYNAALEFNRDINIKAHELNEQIERTLAKVKANNAAKLKVRTEQDLLIKSEFSEANQRLMPKEQTPKSKKGIEKQASQKRIQDAANELRRSGMQAKESNLLDVSTEYIPYKELEKYIESGVFEELGYQRGRNNDAIYNERLKWYGGMNSGFVMNIVGSFMETILSLPKLIVNFRDLLF